MKFLIPLCLCSILLSISADTIDSKKSSYYSVKTSFAYGFDGYNSYGGIIDITRNSILWNRKHISGIATYGVAAGYQISPFTQSNSLLKPAIVSGAGHRLEGFALGGIDLLLPPRKHLLLGIGLFAGWWHIIMDGTLSNDTYGIHGDYHTDKGALGSGLYLKPAYIINNKVSIVCTAIAPLPYAEAEITTWTTISLGVQVNLK